MTDQSTNQPLETCQTCKRDFNPSLVESGECIFCIAKAHRERAEKAEAACAEMRVVLSEAWTDITQWVQLAINHRKSLGERADFTPYCASQRGIDRSEIVLKEIGMAAHSSDCGKGWMAPEKAIELKERCLKAEVRNANLESECAGLRVNCDKAQKLREALRRLVQFADCLIWHRLSIEQRRELNMRDFDNAKQALEETK